MLTLARAAYKEKTIHQNSLLFDIINFLDIHQKPMVITTNISPNDLAHPSEMGRERIYDRIIKNCLMIAVMGDDLRLKHSNLTPPYRVVVGRCYNCSI